MAKAFCFDWSKVVKVEPSDNIDRISSSKLLHGNFPGCEGPPALSPMVPQITLRNVSIGLSIIFSGSPLSEVIALSGVKVY